MVGERLALEVASKAGAAVAGGSLTVSAAYREGLGAPSLLLATSKGAPRNPKGFLKLTYLD